METKKRLIFYKSKAKDLVNFVWDQEIISTKIVGREKAVTGGLRQKLPCWQWTELLFQQLEHSSYIELKIEWFCRAHLLDGGGMRIIYFVQYVVCMSLFQLCSRGGKVLIPEPSDP